MKLSLLFTFLISLSLPFTKQKDTFKVGDALWMTTNLNVSHFRNGDPIPEAKTTKEWTAAFDNKTPVFCYYSQQTKNGLKYGKLYNWYAIHDSRGLAPEGWHVATDAEWTALITAFEGPELASKALSQNEFNFTSGGLRDIDGSFNGEGYSSLYWTSTIDFNFFSYNRQLFADGNTEITRGSSHHGMGAYVRCVKD